MNHATAILYHCVKAFTCCNFTDLFFGDPQQHKSYWIVFSHVLYHAHCLDKNKSAHSLGWGSWGSLFHFLSLWGSAQITTPPSQNHRSTLVHFFQVREVIYGNVNLLFTNLSRMYRTKNGSSRRYLTQFSNKFTKLGCKYPVICHNLPLISYMASLHILSA